MCPKTKWRNLKGKQATIFKDKVIKQGGWNFEGEIKVMWNQMTYYIRKVAKAVLGGSKRKRNYNKET